MRSEDFYLIKSYLLQSINELKDGVRSALHDVVNLVGSRKIKYIWSDRHPELLSDIIEEVEITTDCDSVTIWHTSKNQLKSNEENIQGRYVHARIQFDNAEFISVLEKACKKTVNACFEQDLIDQIIKSLEILKKRMKQWKDFKAEFLRGSSQINGCVTPSNCVKNPINEQEIAYKPGDAAKSTATAPKFFNGKKIAIDVNEQQLEKAGEAACCSCLIQ